MSSLSELRFFVTPEHDCSYLEGEMAVTLFADPQFPIDTLAYTQLTQVGFRRSGNHIYRPHCGDCQACISTRVLVRDFVPHRSHRRLLKKAGGVDWVTAEPSLDDRYYLIYEKYIRDRHTDGDMYPPTREQFESFLVDGREEAVFFEMLLDGELMGVAVADQLEDGLSAIYTFFDPRFDAFSPGTLAILKLIEHGREKRMNYVYLGYWIRDCAKMSYKIRFTPLELLINDKWVRVDT